jgi:ABC-type nitrate/sulfonate/bicarbonate transport system substrate-binding protein
MTPATLTRLQKLIETAAAEAEAQREQAAEAILAASGAPAIAAAYEQGRRDERGRLRALLEAQQEMLGKAGLNSISLATLSRSIEVEP